MNKDILTLKDILEPCDLVLSSIITEIEESDAVVAKVTSCKLKVKLLAVTSSPTPSMTPVAPPTMPAVTLLDMDSFKSVVDKNPQLNKFKITVYPETL